MQRASPRRRVELVGILNVTPDSFSDGGRYHDPDRAVAHGLRMLEEGADLVDVGGESTRPGSEAVTVAEELRRVLPVVERLSDQGARVSIDTSKPEVARRALAAGACVVNDVRALQAPGMLEVVARAGAGAVLMHMRGTPATMQRDTGYGDLVSEVRSFLSERLAAARTAGIEPIWVDPGIGFGKDLAGNLALIAGIGELRSLGAPVYVGASRKSFIGQLTGQRRASERLAGSLGAAAAAVVAGASALRVHDVGVTARMLEVLLPALPAGVLPC